MDNSFYAQKQIETKKKMLQSKAARIKSSLESAEKLLNSLDDHKDCVIYESIRQMVGLRKKRIEENLLENYKSMNEAQLKVLLQEREVCNDIFLIREKLEDEINEGQKSLNQILEKIG